MVSSPVYVAALDTISISPDSVRLLIVLAFLYGAILDYRVRRVYNEFWIPLIGLCFIVLGWDIALLMVESTEMQAEYLFSLALSVVIVPSIAFTLWQRGVFGGADLKALAFLAVFFPQQPELVVSGTTYPLVDGVTPIFTMTVLANALIIAFLYRIVLVGRNVAKADFSRLMTRATRYDTGTLHEKHGDLLEGTRGRFPKGVDLDAVRMYLRWRGISLRELRSNASFYRSTEPVIENDIEDGAVPSSTKTPLGRSRAEYRPPAVEAGPAIVPFGAVSDNPDDAWGAERFTEALAEKETCPSLAASEVRDALEAITRKQKVWVSPAIPFFIPLTAGLVVSLTYGSLLAGFTEWAAELLVEFLL